MMHKTDADYEAERDARSLQEAVSVNNSPKRLKAAQKALKTMVKETQKTLMETRAAQGLKKAFPEEHNSSHKGGY